MSSVSVGNGFDGWVTIQISKEEFDLGFFIELKNDVIPSISKFKSGYRNLCYIKLEYCGMSDLFEIPKDKVDWFISSVNKILFNITKKLKNAMEVTIYCELTDTESEINITKQEVDSGFVQKFHNFIQNTSESYFIEDDCVTYHWDRKTSVVIYDIIDKKNQILIAEYGICDLSKNVIMNGITNILKEIKNEKKHMITCRLKSTSYDKTKKKMGLDP